MTRLSTKKRVKRKRPPAIQKIAEAIKTQPSWPPQCPEGHGQLFDYQSGWYCSHIAHSGRPKSSTAGPRAPTQRWFTRKDLGLP